MNQRPPPFCVSVDRSVRRCCRASLAAPNGHNEIQGFDALEECKPTVLFVAVRIGVVALLAMVLAIMPDEVLLGWFTFGASGAGLVLLIIEELHERVLWLKWMRGRAGPALCRGSDPCRLFDYGHGATETRIG